MSQPHNISGYTVEQAAKIVGVSTSRVRQLLPEIDHQTIGRLAIISEKGITQLKNRKTKPGPSGKE